MMNKLIHFVEENADGCGTNVNVMIRVCDGVYTKQEKQGNIENMLTNALEEIKREWCEWETDSIIKEACDRVFGPFNWFWEDADCVVKF